LNLGLLDLNSKARMRVLPACQLLSATTARAIEYLVKRGLLKNPGAMVFASVIALINDWFDVVNSRESTPRKGIKGPFGSCLDKQVEILKKVIKN
jgi:hypothetical protein